MATVTALEAKTRFGQLLKRVARGEEVVITHHDKPVARLVREGQPDLDAVRKIGRGLRDLRAKIAARPGRSKLTFEEVRSAINEGRR